MSRDFSRAKIGVFWDVGDCPIPDGHNPFSVYKTIESTLKKEGYRDETMEVRVYGGKKNEIPEKLWFEYLSAGLYYLPEGGTCARVNQMLRDILIWALDHPEPSILMVIAENNSEDKKIHRVLEALKLRDHNVLLVQPDILSLELLLPFVCSVWLWKNLFGREKPIDQSSSSQCADNTSACSDQSGSSQDVANKRERKKRRMSKADTKV